MYTRFGKAISKEFVNSKLNVDQYMIKIGKKFGRIAEIKQKKCYVCNGSSSKRIVNFYGVNYVMCKTCSHIYADRRMSESQLNKFYSDDKNYFKHVYPNKKVLKLRMEIFLPKIKFVKKYSKGKNWLDVGSGDGTAVIAAAKVGYNADGTEPSKPGREFAKKFLNLKLHEESLEEFSKKNKRYDVISFFGVLEHIPEPLESLKFCNKILNKNGLIILEVPHFNSITSQVQKLTKRPDRHLVPSHHIMIFTFESAKQILRNTGFKPIATWFYGSDIIELIKLLNYKEPNFQNSELFKTLSEKINDFQTIFDKDKLSDTFLMIGKKIKSS